MIVFKRHRYTRKYNGRGLFDNISNLVKRIVQSSAAQSAASTLARAASSEVGKTAIQGAKTVGTELAKAAINRATEAAVKSGTEKIKGIGRSAPPAAAIMSAQSKNILDSMVQDAMTMKEPMPTVSPAAPAVDPAMVLTNLMGRGMGGKPKRKSRSKRMNIEQMIQMSGSGLRLAVG